MTSSMESVVSAATELYYSNRLLGLLMGVLFPTLVWSR